MVRAEGHTVDVSRKGCLAVVPEGFRVGQHLRIVNLVTNEVAEAVLTWRGHRTRGGWELGLELRDSPPDFWGLEV